MLCFTCPRSWSGIKDGHLDGDELLQDITSKCKTDIKKTDVLIIDEISMISSKILEKVGKLLAFHIINSMPLSFSFNNHVIECKTCKEQCTNNMGKV